MTGENQAILMGRVWKVFEALLQYCCITDFKSITEKMVQDKMLAIEKIKNEYAEYKRQFDSENEKNLERLRAVESQFDNLRLAKNNAEFEQGKITR